MAHAGVAIVTGGASGIGLALGRRLADDGRAVVLADVDASALAAAAASFPPGARVETAVLDVTDETAVREIVAGAAARHGRLDQLFNNAGVGGTMDVRDATLAHWRRIVELNLMGVVHGVQAAYPIMVRQGSGCIVNTASISGLMPWPGQTLYNTTKYAVVGLSHSLRSEAARFGVQVNVVCPGPVRSAIWGTPILGTRIQAASPDFAMTAEAAAAEIFRGVARNLATITLPRSARRQAWLYRMHPGLLRSAFARQLRHMPPP